MGPFSIKSHQHIKQHMEPYTKNFKAYPSFTSNYGRKCFNDIESYNNKASMRRAPRRVQMKQKDMNYQVVNSQKRV